jgi:hypothetical protein
MNRSVDEIVRQAAERISELRGYLPSGGEWMVQSLLGFRGEPRVHAVPDVESVIREAIAEAINEMQAKLLAAEQERDEWRHRAVGETCRVMSDPDCRCSLCIRDHEIQQLRNLCGYVELYLAHYDDCVIKRGKPQECSCGMWALHRRLNDAAAKNSLDGFEAPAPSCDADALSTVITTIDVAREGAG